MGTGANPWRYVFELVNEGYEIDFSNFLFGTRAMEIKLTKGIHHAKLVITQESLERNMLGDNLLMYEALKKLRKMVDEEAEKGEEK